MPSGSQCRLTNDTPTSCAPALTGTRHREALIGRVHVDFPLRIALRVARKALRRRHPFPLSADREPLDQRPVETDVDLVRFAHANQIQIELPPEHAP